MRYALIALLASTLLFASCGGSGNTPATAPATDSAINDSAAYAADYSESEYDTVYVVVLDTNQNYYILQEKMYPLAATLGLVIDTMNRYYDLDKDRIVLNENDEDEMFRGEYFPPPHRVSNHEPRILFIIRHSRYRRQHSIGRGPVLRATRRRLVARAGSQGSPRSFYETRPHVYGLYPLNKRSRTA